MTTAGLVVGIDLSLTATGVAAFGEYTSAPIVATVKTTADDGTVFGFMRRCESIASAIRSQIGNVWPDMVVIEGLSFHSKSSSIDKIHASWWVIQDDLESAGWPPARVVTPNQRAKYATGKGNASKDAVLIETVKRYPDLDIRNNNEADAVILAAMGMRALGYPVEASLPQANLDSVRDFVALLGGET